MGSTGLTAGSWRSDHKHSVIRFEVPFLGVGRALGVFREHSVDFTVGEDGLELIEIEVPAASVDTLDEVRDNEIRSMDFLDVESHPTIRYRSDAIKPAEDGRLTIDGGLTVNGITHQVEFDVKFSDVVTAPDGTECVGVTGMGYVSRQAFGLRETEDPMTKGTPEGDVITVTATLTMLRRRT